MWDTRIKYEISQVEHFIFSPCLHQEKYLRIQMSAFDIFTQPPQLPKKRPLLTMSLPVTVASQFASLSPLALSSSLLTTARSDLPPGSFLRPAAVQSRRQLPRWFSSWTWCIMFQWTLDSSSPLAYASSCCLHLASAIVDTSLCTVSDASPKRPKEKPSVETLTYWAIFSLIIFHISCSAAIFHEQGDKNLFSVWKWADKPGGLQSAWLLATLHTWHRLKYRR